MGKLPKSLLELSQEFLEKSLHFLQRKFLYPISVPGTYLRRSKKKSKGFSKCSFNDFFKRSNSKKKMKKRLFQRVIQKFRFFFLELVQEL